MGKGGAGRKPKPANRNKPAELRDALGRRARAERRRIERLKAKRTPLDAWGHHPVVALFPEVAKMIRKELKLSLAGAAELAEMKAWGVDRFEKSKGGGQNQTLGKLCRGYGITVVAFVRRAQRLHERRSHRARNGAA